MRSRRATWAAIIILAIVVIGGTAYLLHPKPVPAPVPEAAAPAQTGPKSEVIGTSVGGRAITAYTYGMGPDHLLLVGGVHGGYEWNSVLLAYDFMDYFAANPNAIPANMSVTIVPSANPDAVFNVVGKEGRFTQADVSTDATLLATNRFNADKVDLNRNFDCHWQATSTWQNKPVSAGTAAFSEPEAKALEKIVEETHPIAVVSWHSQSDGVYASECDAGVLPTATTLMNTYSKASGYPAYPKFDAYPITGDMEGWLAKIGIPAVTVEMKTHSTVEWPQNLAGIQALLALYGTPAAQ